MIKDGLRIEHDTAKFNAFVKEEGWNFDEEKANSTLKKMTNRMTEIESILEPKLFNECEVDISVYFNILLTVT